MSSIRAISKLVGCSLSLGTAGGPHQRSEDRAGLFLPSLSPLMTDRFFRDGSSQVREAFNLQSGTLGLHAPQHVDPFGKPIWLQILNNSWVSNDVSITDGFVLFIALYAQVCASSQALSQVNIAWRLLATWHWVQQLALLIRDVALLG